MDKDSRRLALICFVINLLIACTVESRVIEFILMMVASFIVLIVYINREDIISVLVYHLFKRKFIYLESLKIPKFFICGTEEQEYNTTCIDMHCSLDFYKIIRKALDSYNENIRKYGDNGINVYHIVATEDEKVINIDKSIKYGDIEKYLDKCTEEQKNEIKSMIMELKLKNL